MGTVITLDPDLYEPLDDVIARQPVSVECPGYKSSYLYSSSPPRDWQRERFLKLHDYPRVRIARDLTPEQEDENEAEFRRDMGIPHMPYVDHIRKTDSADFERWLFDHRVEEVVTRLREQKKEPEPTAERPSRSFGYDGSFYGYGHHRSESRVRRYLVNAAIGGASGGTFAVIAHLLLS